MNDEVKEVLKEALLLERRGKAFYEGVARSAGDEGVRDTFATMADEERKHIEKLEGLFREESGTEPLSLPDIPARTLDAVLTPKVREKIEAAGYEAAAIYAAMGMEEKAVAFYSEQAEDATGALKELFSWLADWERTHLDLLMALNEDLRQRVWQDQRFWPF